MRSTAVVVVVLVLGVVACSSALAVAVAVDESAQRMPYDWRERHWVYPAIVEDEAMYIASPHPAAPKTHVEPAYELPPNAGLSADEIEHRRLWAVNQPNDGTPFKPVYHNTKPAAPEAIRIPPPLDRPTVMSPFKKPERVVGSHYPPIPDQPCVCKYKVSDPRLCTEWKAAPLYECVKGTKKECYKYGAYQVKQTCPCVHADNNRKCYVFAPPGTRVADYQPPKPRVPPKWAMKQRKIVTAREVVTPPKRSASAATAATASAATQTPAAQTAVSTQPKPNHPNRPASANWIVSPIPFTPSNTAGGKSARRLAVDSVVDARVWAAREKAAKRWEEKKQRKMAARARSRDERRANYVTSQAAEKHHMPLSRNVVSRPTLTSADGRVQLSSNGNARPVSGGLAVAATEYDKDLLTRVVYAEAEFDDEPGRRAVVWSMINRARDPKRRFPMAIADVCKQKGEFRTLANPKLVEAAKSLSRHSAAYKEIRQIVDDALAGRSIDPTHGGCFYFYNGHIAPQWIRGQDCTFRSKVHTFCHTKH